MLERPAIGGAATVSLTNDAHPDHEGAPKPVVLVVEDEVLVQMLVLEVLEDLGIEALEANDGPSALEILEADPRIALLVTDVGLPGMNGRQLAETARRLRPDLKVLFVTGYADKAAAGEFGGEGMDMITKPFALEALSGKVMQMLGQPA
jgi:CheY-like chemotaxis protein